MALILANLRLSRKTPVSRDSEKIDAKGKAIRDEASLGKLDGITPARLFLNLAIAFVTSPGDPLWNLTVPVSNRSRVNRVAPIRNGSQHIGSHVNVA